MKKKYIFTILMILMSVLLLNTMDLVRADSGFDTSYDSGGGGGWSSSSSSSSSWGGSSSSSWSSHDSYSHSSGSGGGSFTGDSNAFVFMMIFIYIVLPLIVIAAHSKQASSDMKHSVSHIGNSFKPRYWTDHEILEYIPDFEYTSFIHERFNDYVAIQDAWSLFDYNTLRGKLTDELYNQYVYQLDAMKVKREQNIMSDFKLVKGNVTNITKVNERLELTMELVVSFYDYIVRDGQVVRGSKTKKVMIYYEIVFVCDRNAVTECPNCHAKLNNSSSQVCEYCRAVINRTGENWVMAKKRNTKQY